MIVNLTGRRFDAEIVNAFLMAHEDGEIRVREQATDDAADATQTGIAN